MGIVTMSSRRWSNGLGDSFYCTAKSIRKKMGPAEIRAYLEHVAKTDKDALRALEAAYQALEFLYVVFLERRLDEFGPSQSFLISIFPVLYKPHFGNASTLRNSNEA